MPASDLLAWRRELLASTGGARADLDWLLDLGGGLHWPELQALHLYPHRMVWLLQPLARIEDLWRRHRRTAEPLQYLVGRCPWRDLELQVGPGVLIPRQETELLVDLALALAPPTSGGVGLRWADLGTGCGALAVALARALPAGRGLAVDASDEALTFAALNRAAAGVEERFTLMRSDWWQALKPWSGELDLVVANPPYIPTITMENLEPMVRDHEPRRALDGGSDGLVALRTICAGAAQALAPGGVLLLEHHHDQSQSVGLLLEMAGLEDVRAHRDPEGVLRFASGRQPVGGGTR
ncbi:MAG: peptide chain release factor N(5)-glutamine methyltransferase [Cyanobacteria bacterium]|nr:peptide chain release factor N(5)-glutamine methyltransferase [Cyanobacteriota bacterium]